MNKNLNLFLNSFQDMYLENDIKLDKYPLNLIENEYTILYNRIANLSLNYTENYELIEKTVYEFEKLLDTTVKTLNEKLDYINYSAKALSNLVVLYDKYSLIDYKLYNLSNNVLNEVYYNKDSLVLRHNSVVYQTTKEVINTKEIIFFNTSKNFHNSIRIEYKNIALLEEVDITVLKTDGTELNFLKNSLIDLEDFFILEHDLINTVHVHLKFKQSFISNNLTMSILKNNYVSKGTISLEPYTYKCSKYLTFNWNAVVPNNTYINLNLNAKAYNEEGQAVVEVDFTLPVNNTVICKELELVNFEEIKTLKGIYYNNTFTDEITIENLKDLLSKNLKNRYVIYLPVEKTKDAVTDIINNFVTNQLVFNNNKIKTTVINANLDFYSFSKNKTPSLSRFIGTSSNES